MGCSCMNRIAALVPASHAGAMVHVGATTPTPTSPSPITMYGPFALTAAIMAAGLAMAAPPLILGMVLTGDGAWAVEKEQAAGTPSPWTTAVMVGGFGMTAISGARWLLHLGPMSWMWALGVGAAVSYATVALAATQATSSPTTSS